MKKALAVLIATMMLWVVVGCSSTPTEETPPAENPAGTETEGSEGASTNGAGDNTAINVSEENKEVDGEQASSAVIGEIVQIEGDQVDVVSGDIVERYTVENTDKALYLGQWVSVEQKGEKAVVVPYLEKDYSVKFTSMGDKMLPFKGVVKEVKAESFVVGSGDEIVEISTSPELKIKVGSEVSGWYANFDETAQLIELYDEANKLEASVEKIDRSEEGELILTVKAGDKTYTCYTKNASIERNISEIAEGDVLTVYHNGTSENPKEINATLIR